MHPPAILLAVEWDGTAGPSATQHDGADKATHVLVGRGTSPLLAAAGLVPLAGTGETGGRGKERQARTKKPSSSGCCRQPPAVRVGGKGWSRPR